MDSSLRIEHTKTPKYLKGPATWWDIDPKDDAQVDEVLDEIQLKLVGVPFSMIGNANNFDLDRDIPMVEPNAFVQQLDAKPSWVLP